MSKDYRHHKLTAEQNALIDKFQQKLPDKSVNIYGLAIAFGCKVYGAEMPPGISGAIAHEEEGYCIYTNSDEPEVRQRFTCAHELAHFLLHKEDLGKGFRENIMYRSNLSNDKEIEANKIAADILIPMEQLNETAETRKYTVPDLAKIFGVSRQVLLVRLGIPEYTNKIYNTPEYMLDKA